MSDYGKYKVMHRGGEDQHYEDGGEDGGKLCLAFMHKTAQCCSMAMLRYGTNPTVGS